MSHDIKTEQKYRAEVMKTRTLPINRQRWESSERQIAIELRGAMGFWEVLFFIQGKQTHRIVRWDHRAALNFALHYMAEASTIGIQFREVTQ